MHHADANARKQAYSFTKESEECCHLLPLDDNSWCFGHFRTIRLILALARLSLPRRALGVLAIGSFEPEPSPDLEGLRGAIGFDPDGSRGGSLAPPLRMPHHALVWIICWADVWCVLRGNRGEVGIGGGGCIYISIFF